ncbi:MAG: hypothetical protein ABL958_13655 [Bdellovibrionia bacterium]
MKSLSRVLFALLAMSLCSENLLANPTEYAVRHGATLEIGLPFDRTRPIRYEIETGDKDCLLYTSSEPKGLPRRSKNSGEFKVGKKFVVFHIACAEMTEKEYINAISMNLYQGSQLLNSRPLGLLQTPTDTTFAVTTTLSP